jgi:hypothetical protein
MDTTDTQEPQDPLLVQLHDARLDRRDAAAQLARQDAQAEDARAEVVHLIRHLYVDLDQNMGGPLHVQLDDGNLGDYWVGEEANRGRYDYLFNGDFERYSQAGDDVSGKRKVAIHDTCERILALLRPMSEADRHAAIDEFQKGWRS